MKMVNLTPNLLNIQQMDYSMLTVPASGIVAQVEQQTEWINSINGLDVFRICYGSVIDLPEPEKGTIYIVSALTAQAAKDREDVFYPGPALRDDEGKIIGCIGLCK